MDLTYGKGWLALLAATVGLAQLRAEDLTTTNGKIYHDVQVKSRSSSTMVIHSAEGPAVIPLASLKAADRDKYSKDLTKAIELPALEVMGEEKPKFTKEQREDKSVAFADKELRRQALEKKEKAEDKALHPEYKPIEIFKGVGFTLNTQDPKDDAATKPTYLNPDYQRLSPSLVEKPFKDFAKEAEENK